MIIWALGSYCRLVVALFSIATIGVLWHFYQLICLIKKLDSTGHLLRGISRCRMIIRAALSVIALLLLAIVVLRPQWNELPTDNRIKTRDVVIALDVSPSMLADDVKPSRMQLAQKKIKDLIITLGADRVGLIFFSSQAQVQCPLTTDRDLVLKFLDQAQDSIAQASTRLDIALEKLLDLIERGEAKNKIALLVTDGEDFSQDLSGLRQRAQALGVTIITLGVGTSRGGKIPVVDTAGRRSLLKDEQGREVLTKLNEPMLRALALQTGGFYVPLSADDTALATVVAFVEKQEQHETEGQQHRQYEDHYGVFAFGALLALTLEWLL